MRAHSFISPPICQSALTGTSRNFASCQFIVEWESIFLQRDDSVWISLRLPTSFISVWLLTLKLAALTLDKEVKHLAQSAQIRIKGILFISSWGISGPTAKVTASSEPLGQPQSLQLVFIFDTFSVKNLFVPGFKSKPPLCSKVKLNPFIYLSDFFKFSLLIMACYFCCYSFKIY